MICSRRSGFCNLCAPIDSSESVLQLRGCSVQNLTFDQVAGYGNWKTQWSHEHQRYCCYKSGEACVTKAGIRLKAFWC